MSVELIPVNYDIVAVVGSGAVDRVSEFPFPASYSAVYCKFFSVESVVHLASGRVKREVRTYPAIMDDISASAEFILFYDSAFIAEESHPVELGVSFTDFRACSEKQDCAQNCQKVFHGFGVYQFNMF